MKKIKKYGLEILGRSYIFDNIPLRGGLGIIKGDDIYEPYKVFLDYNYNISQEWSLELKNTLVGKGSKPSSATTFVPNSYYKADLVANYYKKDLSLQIGIYNLFDKRYYNYYDVKDLSENKSNITSYSQPGRSISVGLNYQF